MASASQMGSRLVFENAKTLIRQLGYNTDHAVLTQSYLRGEVLLNTTQASYQVPILVNTASNTNNTVRSKLLQLQDLFIVSNISIFLVKGAANNGAATNYTYPNVTAFPTGSAQLYNLYNGSLSIVANNQQILPAWDILKHYFVPQTQNGVGITAQTVFPIDQVDFYTDASCVVEPNIVLNGAANYQININLPAAPTAIDSNTFVALKFNGLLAQNCTSVK
jgi:hypothetical protein